MSFVNYKRKEINCKVAFFGPGMGGKTTNIQYIFQKSSGDQHHELTRIGATNDRTLFFDFLPLDIGEFSGMKVKLHLYTVPGQSFYEESRRTILRGVDGIIFVADSQVDRMDENIASYQEMEQILKDNFIDSVTLPLVFQWNKRDLPNVVSLEHLNAQLNKRQLPNIEGVATRGEGVFEALNLISKIILSHLKSRPI